MTDLVLASTSVTRARLLRAAGLQFDVEAPPHDEEALKAGLRAAGLSPRDQADALAEGKALSVSRRRSGFVIGGDQMPATEDAVFDRPRDRADAKAQLEALRGRTHALYTAVVIASDGAPIWRLVDAPKLTMRAFSDAFLEIYLDRAGPEALESVGGYRLEGLGSQLFEQVEGDYFSVLGLPLLPLLAFLRMHGLAPE